MMEWNNHFDYVHRSKIIRKIIELQKLHDKQHVEGSETREKKVWSESDLTYLQISVLEDLIS